MGRSPCCDENGLKKGPWTPEEDHKLVRYIQKHGRGSWRSLPKLAGLNRCGKSCRLRWTNYLRPDIKRGRFSAEEEHTILNLHSILGNKWSSIASHLPGRTDNEIKNFWNTHLKKKLIQMGFDPMTHRPRTDFFATLQQLIAVDNLRKLIEGRPWDDHAARLQAEPAKLQYFHLLQQLATAMEAPSVPSPAPYRDIAGQKRDDGPLPELQVPCFFFDQPISDGTTQSSNPIGLSLGDTSPGSPFMPPLPPLADVSIGNLQGDARSGNPPPPWPEILFDDPFLVASVNL
ncbi:unnamed protein product [Musa textilis]